MDEGILATLATTLVTLGNVVALLIRRTALMLRFLTVWLMTAVIPLNAGWMMGSSLVRYPGDCPCSLVPLNGTWHVFVMMRSRRALLAGLLTPVMTLLFPRTVMFAALLLTLMIVLLVTLRMAPVVAALLMMVA